MILKGACFLVGQLLLLLAATELHAASIILPSSPAYAECRADERRTQAWFDAVQQPLRPPPCCEMGCGGCCASLEHHQQ